MFFKITVNDLCNSIILIHKLYMLAMLYKLQSTFFSNPIPYLIQKVVFPDLFISTNTQNRHTDEQTHFRQLQKFLQLKH